MSETVDQKWNALSQQAKDYHLNWPGNKIACSGRNLELHDALCDALEFSGYSEKEVVDASVGIWAGMKVGQDMAADEVKELTRKGEELCCKNGSILIKNYNLRAILKRALICHYPQQLDWMTDAEKLLGDVK